MTTIKIIYQKKIHKLPASVDKYQDIITTINKLQPNLQKFYIYALINPNFGQDGIGEINCELSFQFLKNIYKQMQWTTIRLLITEHQDINKIYQESWQQLNQSEIVLANSKFEQRSQIIIEKVVEVVREQPKKENIKNNQNLQEVVCKLIDQRLRYYGLIQSQEVEDKINYLQQIYPQKERYELQQIVLGWGRNLKEEEIASMILDK